MPKDRLSKERIEGYKPREKPYIVWDTACKGLGLRVSPTGTKTFLAWARLKDGTQRRPSLGPYHPGVDLAEIRREARRKLTAPAEDGEIVPSRRGALTLAEYAEIWWAKGINRKANVKIQKRESTRAEERRKLDKYILPRLGRKKLADITRTNIDEMHDAIARDFPIQANRCLSVLRALLNQAVDDDVLDRNPIAGAKRVKMAPEQGRKVRLDEAQLKALGDVLRQTQIRYKSKGERKQPERIYTMNPYIVAALKLLLYTGCRRGEIFGLAWSDVDIEGKRLHLRQTKTVPRDVLLNKPALRVLRELQEISIGPWVLPGRAKGQHMTNVQKQWQIIREAAGLDDFPIHGTRHTFASVGKDLGVPVWLMADLLGHKLPDFRVTDGYSHAGEQGLRAETEKIGAWIAAALGEPLEEKQQAPEGETDHVNGGAKIDDFLATETRVKAEGR